MRRGNNTDNPAKKGGGKPHARGVPEMLRRVAHCGQEALPGLGKQSL